MSENRIMNLEGDDLDAALLAAIDEADEEEKRYREEKRAADSERIERERVEAQARIEDSLNGVPGKSGADLKSPVDNSRLVSLLSEFPDKRNDREYLGELLPLIENSRFLVPAHVPEDGPVGQNGKKRLQIIMLTRKENPDRRSLPLFTGPDTLALWKQLMEDQKKPGVAVMPFAEAAKFALKDGFDIAINPMGPVPLTVPSAMVKKIAEHASDPKVRNEVIRDGSKIMIGPPRENDETSAVRQALLDYCAGAPSISRAGLLYIMRGGKVTYFVVVDAPKEDAKTVFSGIMSACRPHFSEIREMNFSLLSQARFANDYYKKKKWDYFKG